MTQAIDPTVLERQSFGSMLSKSSRDRALADRVMSGVLELNPHPAWTMPESLTWAEDPFTQRNWVAQLHMLRWLDPVRRVALEGDETARRYWLRTARSWIEQNPRGTGASKYAWANMVDGIRAQVLLLGTALAGPSDLEWLRPAVEAHGEWIVDPSHLGHSNHALHQHQGLFVLGRAMARTDWVELAVQRLGELLEISYDEQGVNAEGAPAYHRNNLIWWAQAMKRLDLENVARPPAAGRLDRAALALAHATRPDGLLEMIGDTSATRPTGVPSDHLRYVVTEGADGTPPEARSVVLDRGYVFGRSGWGEFETDFTAETFYSACFGPADRVHGHPDGGSLTFYANRRPWLVDSGKYGYISDQMRDFVTSRAAHNSVQIVGVPYDTRAVVQLERHTLGDQFDDLQFFDPGYDGVDLTRRVVYCRGGDFLLVVDDVVAEDDVTAEQLWHLAPEVTTTVAADGVDLDDGSVRAQMQWCSTRPEIDVVRGSEDPFQGWTSTLWAQREAADVVVARLQGRRSRFVTFLASPRKGDFRVDELVTSPESLTASVTSGGERYELDLTFERARRTNGRPRGPEPRGSWSSNVLARTRRALAAAGGAIDASLVDDPVLASTLVRAAVREGGGGPELRMAGAALLVERLESLTDRRGDGPNLDHGIRAAVIDLVGTDAPPGLPSIANALGALRQPVVGWDADLVHPRYKLPIHLGEDFLTGGQGRLDTPRLGLLERGGLAMPFAVRDGEGDVLVVRLHGALNRTRTELPAFRGLNADVRESAAFLNLQDPTLDLDRSLTLAWFLGTSEVNAQQEAAGLVGRVATALGKRRIVLIGSSGGGYVAMQLATRLPGSVALAINPQTELRSYHRPAIARAIAASFGVDPDEALDDEREQRLSLPRRLAHGGLDSQVLIVQNTGDTHHLREHLAPLQESVQQLGLTDRFEVTEIDSGPGHQSPAAEELAEHLGRAIELSASLTDRGVTA